MSVTPRIFSCFLSHCRISSASPLWHHFPHTCHIYLTVS